jgi:dTDP-glucose pyrophosphorylase
MNYGLVLQQKKCEIMKNKRIKELFVDISTPIIVAMQQMDTIKRKLLIVTKDNKYHSLLSIGDIQRAIISNISTDTSIDNILRNDVKVASTSDNKEQVIQSVKERRNEFMPIVNSQNEIVDVIFWEDQFLQTQRESKPNLDLPVVIMAGGEGTRLRPLTNVFPKPLLPIGKQTIIEDIMDNFVEYGCNNFYLSVNYKAEFLKLYFESISGKDYKINFFQEHMPLGTAGSLRLLKNKITTTFFVSNCDIIVEDDYSEILKYHKENKNEITMVAAVKKISIPYGTLETKENGLLLSLQEKPNITFKINTGFYILEPQLIDEIPENKFYHITFLIEKLINENRKVGVFPVSEGSWTDVGTWDEYLKMI